MFRTSRFFAATILSSSNASAAAVLCLIAGVLLTGCDKSETQLANRNDAGDENKGSIERTSEGVIPSGNANSSVAIERSPVDPKNITVDEQGYVKLGDPEPIPASAGEAPGKDTVLNASGLSASGLVLPACQHLPRRKRQHSNQLPPNLLCLPRTVRRIQTTRAKPTKRRILQPYCH